MNINDVYVNYWGKPKPEFTDYERALMEGGHSLNEPAEEKFTFLKSLSENFADGRHPEDKGDAKRHGIDTKASISSLRKTAKQGGRKGQLAHWLANMKSGRAKNK